ncbi:132_t:CDS:2, partial [Dentiscutata erythropus]
MTNSQIKKQQKHLKNIRQKRTFFKDTTLNKIQSNRYQSIEQIVKDLIDLNDSKFTETIEQIKRIYNVNEESEQQRNELINKIQNLPTNQVSRASYLFQVMKNTSIQAITTKIIELEKEISFLKKDKINLTAHIRSLSIQVVHARDTKKRYISKIRIAIQNAKQVQPNQLCSTEISNMGVTLIQTTVNCTKAVYEFLTGHTPTYW